MPLIEPQPGAQSRFLSCPADIAIYGGGAGGGKSWALLIEPTRHLKRKDFSAVIFRRNLTQVKNPGGLWDESSKIYLPARGVAKTQTMEWIFPSGAKIRFAHLEYDSTVYNWQGAQVPLICFDELTHFSKTQFFYMLSRNRSMCGIRPYIRATCNPDADSWVAEFIAWWIDPDSGLPVPERAGQLRWFVRVDDALIWADDPEDLARRYPALPPKSVTFVPARLEDNPALLAADPGYRANLLALPTVDRERLLSGNWKIRPAAGLYFHRSWCDIVDAIPAGLDWVRAWDLAATPKTESNDPDWTVGVKMGRDANGYYWISDVIRFRGNPGDVETLLKNTAALDGQKVAIGLAQDPGQAGKAQAAWLARALAGFDVRFRLESGDKVTRFGPFSAQARAGNIRISRSSWTDIFLSALEGFPDAAHDDDADAASAAFQMFHAGNTGLLDFYNRIAKGSSSHDTDCS